jgi:hypothetical protein
MEHYAAIDVSLELSSVCVVDAKGKIARERRKSRAIPSYDRRYRAFTVADFTWRGHGRLSSVPSNLGSSFETRAPTRSVRLSARRNWVSN